MARVPGMSDISSGLFALGGALIGTTGTQITAIINAASKSKARKAATERADTEARAQKRRPLYQQLIKDADAAGLYVDWLIVTYDDPSRGPDDPLPQLRDHLAAVRASATSVQIDGSDRAEKIASAMLSGVDRLWHVVTEDETLVQQDRALSQAHSALITAHSDLIAAAREDFGG